MGIVSGSLCLKADFQQIAFITRTQSFRTCCLSPVNPVGQPDAICFPPRPSGSVAAAFLQVHQGSAKPVDPAGFWRSRSVLRPGGPRMITSPPHHCEPAASQEKSRLARSRQLGCEARGEKVIKLLCRVLTHEHFWACPEGAPPPQLQQETIGACDF